VGSPGGEAAGEHQTPGGRAKGSPVLHASNTCLRAASGRDDSGLFSAARTPTTAAVFGQQPQIRAGREAMMQTGNGMVAEVKASGQSKIRHCRLMTSEQKRLPLLMRWMSAAGAAETIGC
jgi:hypothetical protein